MWKKLLALFQNKYRTVFISDQPSRYRAMQDRLYKHDIESKLYIEDRLNSREFPMRPLAKIQVKQEDYDHALRIVHDHRD